jgi:hypothetical protein
MLSAVRDRRREIGLKRALGASSASIILQFLMEAMIVSCRGGIIGVCVGCACCLMLQLVFDLDATLVVLALSIPAGIDRRCYPGAHCRPLSCQCCLQYGSGDVDAFGVRIAPAARIRSGLFESPSPAQNRACSRFLREIGRQQPPGLLRISDIPRWLP